MTNTMRAVVLDAPEPPEALQIRDLPIPTTQPGQVLIKVEAFGLAARSSTLGSALPRGVTFPRVLGIEATGTVADSPGGEFVTGQQVAAMMGGMGRTFDGGYAEYTCVPVQQVVPFTSSLDWDSRGAVREMLQTSHGSLTVGLRRPARAVDPHPRWHVVDRHGDRRARQAARHDGAVHHSQTRPRRRPP